MQAPKLEFNIIPFAWEESSTLYFQENPQPEHFRLHPHLYPNEIEKLFPGLHRREVNFIGTSFSTPVEGFMSLAIQPSTENPILVQCHYNHRIFNYFHCQEMVRTGPLNQNEIWIPSNQHQTDEYLVFEKFLVQVKVRTVSNGPELYLSYNGQGKVLQKSIKEIIQTVSPSLLNQVVVNNRIIPYHELANREFTDYNNAFPVLNHPLRQALKMEAPAVQKRNRYQVYHNHIHSFYKNYLDTPQFREIIPLHQAFLQVSPASIHQVHPQVSGPYLEKGLDRLPKAAAMSGKPYCKSPHNKIHLFFIAHQTHAHLIETLKDYFNNGTGVFKGMYDYAGLSLHPQHNCNIIFSDSENPLPEIRAALDRNQTYILPHVRYIAVNITPCTKYEPDLAKQKVHYRITQELLKREITSQSIEAGKINEKPSFGYSLTNSAVAMLAKLDGIPWRLDTPVKQELVVGIGAFHSQTEKTGYICTSLCFNNEGRFKAFDCFLKREVHLLAGYIANAVAEYEKAYQYPVRLIIHFYKKGKQKELAHIQKAIKELNLPKPLPVFIITIHKPESKDILAFDTAWSGLLPPSGTLISLDKHQYLLYNNAHYQGMKFETNNSYPFPLRLSIDCNVKKLVENKDTVLELISQVYQFSRMYWKSVRQQNLPVTIKYPEMVAQIAPYFEGNDISHYGKSNLWFL